MYRQQSQKSNLNSIDVKRIMLKCWKRHARVCVSFFFSSLQRIMKWIIYFITHLMYSVRRKAHALFGDSIHSRRNKFQESHVSWRCWLASNICILISSLHFIFFLILLEQWSLKTTFRTAWYDSWIINRINKVAAGWNSAYVLPGFI